MREPEVAHLRPRFSTVNHGMLRDNRLPFLINFKVNQLHLRHCIHFLVTLMSHQFSDADWDDV